MKLRRVRVHNYRSIHDIDIDLQDYTLLVGANNAGKSTIVNALRLFYDGVKWTEEDLPHVPGDDNDSWVELAFDLEADDWNLLDTRYKDDRAPQRLTVRRTLATNGQAPRGNTPFLHAVIGGELSTEGFYGGRASNLGKLGEVIYIPALTTPGEQLRTTGPSPLRQMLALAMKRASATAFRQVERAFAALNEEANGPSGFLTDIRKPISDGLRSWGIDLELTVNPIGIEDIPKSLIGFKFTDTHSNRSLDLERFGHGFQRAAIYETIRAAASIAEPVHVEKNEFAPDFALILFEEPEAFLHPSQQDRLAHDLRTLSRQPGQQVLVTTHSPVFAGRAANQLEAIVRVTRDGGVSHTRQPHPGQLEGALRANEVLRAALRAYLEDVALSKRQREEAERLVAGNLTPEEAEQNERFRHQLWLDDERAAAFFASKVLLVEGPTERILLSYLMAHGWSELRDHNITVVDSIGKYNLPRLMALLEVFGVPHGVLLDDDNGKDHHKVVNGVVTLTCGPNCLASPVLIPNDIERFLGLDLPGRNDQKPLEMLKALDDNRIEERRLADLRNLVEDALGLGPACVAE